jgi:aminopeptidase N
LEIAWVDADGGEHSRMVHVTRARETYVVAMGSAPVSVRVDPRMQVLHSLTFNPGADLLKRQLTESPDCVGRILAARELCLAGDRESVSAVVDAFGKELFWGVRVEIAKVLGETKTKAGVAALPGILRSESDNRALEKVILAVRGLREPVIMEALIELAQRDLPPRATRALHEVLGGFSSSAPFDLLSEAAGREGFQGIAQSGAFVGLGAANPKKAHRRLCTASAPGESPARARVAVATALGVAGKRAESKKVRRRIVETLCLRLRDPNDRVQLAAARALAAMEATEATGEIEWYARTLAHQDEVIVMRLVDKLRREARKTAKTADEEVEKLRSEVKSLRETVDLLKARLDA